MASDAPRVTVELTRKEIEELCRWHWKRMLLLEHEPSDRAAYHRAREAELRVLIEAIDG